MRERGHPTAFQRALIVTRLFRFFLALSLLAFGSAAFASFPPVTQYTYRTGQSGSQGPASDTALGSCVAWFGTQTQASLVGNTSTYEGKEPQLGTYSGSYNDVGCGFAIYVKSNNSLYGISFGAFSVISRITGVTACPANSTGTTECTCAAGFDQSGSACVPHVNQCTGKTGVVNMSIGWQRTPNIGSSEPLVGAYPFSGGAATMCVAGCTMDVTPSEPCPGCKAQVSQTPNDQGLYRVSAEFMGKATGAECTAGPADAPVTPDNSKDPPCPGYVGDVNGVKGCYGTASKPVVTTPPSPAVSSTPKVPGNPPAGPSSPAAATPSAGGGGSAGGPAAAAGSPTGSGGTGTVTSSQNGSGRVGTQSGTEQAACGAPGQPPCKIDETGTQEGVGTSFNEGKGLLDQNRQTAETAMNAAQQIQAPTWSFSFQLPSGCSSYQVASFKGVAFTMNPCTYQSTIHDLMSMVWAAVTAFCLIGMVGRTIREA